MTITTLLFVGQGLCVGMVILCIRTCTYTDASYQRVGREQEMLCTSTDTWGITVFLLRERIERERETGRGIDKPCPQAWIQPW